MTGTSVLAAKFKDGVVIAADNLGMHYFNTMIEGHMTDMHDSFIRFTRPLHRRQAPTEIQ